MLLGWIFFYDIRPTFVRLKYICTFNNFLFDLFRELSLTDVLSSCSLLLNIVTKRTFFQHFPCSYILPCMTVFHSFDYILHNLYYIFVYEKYVQNRQKDHFTIDSQILPENSTIFINHVLKSIQNHLNSPRNFF